MIRGLRELRDNNEQGRGLKGELNMEGGMKKQGRGWVQKGRT